MNFCIKMQFEDNKGQEDMKVRINKAFLFRVKP